MDNKPEAIAIIQEMPSDSTIEDIMEELYFKAQVDTGLKQLDNGEFVTQDEVKQRVSKWFDLEPITFPGIRKNCARIC